jgi:hypothetical protein
MQRMRNKRLGLSLAVVGIIASTAFYAFPKASGEGLAAQIPLAFALTILGMSVLSVWFLLTGLKSFKADLRKVYYLLSTSTILLCLFQTQPIADMLPLGLGEIMELIGIITWLLGAFFMYLGARKLARILDVKSWWRPFGKVAVLALMTAVSSAFIALHFAILPAGAPEDIRPTLAIMLGIVGWSGAFGFATAMLSLQIRKSIGVAYKAPMLWLALSQFFLALGSAQESVRNIVPIFPDWYLAYGLNLWVLLASGLFMLRAAQLFKEVGQPADALAATATPLDNVMYVAQLVSNPHEVEASLNKIRNLTAMNQSGTQTTPSSTGVIKQAYLELEDYLINHEPLRQIDKAYLRARLSDDFRQLVER